MEPIDWDWLCRWTTLEDPDGEIYAEPLAVLFMPDQQPPWRPIRFEPSIPYRLGPRLEAEGAT